MGARLLHGRALVGLLSSLALVAVLTWGASPYGRYLEHGEASPGVMGELTGTVLYLAGWLLMTAVMMLPPAEALVRTFDRVVARRPSAAGLRLALIGGLLAVWLLVGYAFRALDLLVHAGVASVGWLADRPALLVAAAVGLAGAYQFSALKDRCLVACRSPRFFIARGWTGANPVVDALRIGADFGRSCVGCCWALMLVMFAVGTASITWMLGLAAIMSAERFAPAALRGRVRAATGGGLLAVAVVFTARAAGG